MVKAAQDGRRCDFLDVSIRYWLSARIDRVWNALPEPLMRPKVIVVVDVFLHRLVQLLQVQNEPMIEALSLQASYKALANGIRPRCLDRCLQFFDARAPRNG